MKYTKRWIGLLLALVMLCSTASTGVIALAQEPPGTEGRVCGTFRFPCGGGHDSQAPFVYDDAYFQRSAYEYQNSLATMTLSVALSAFGSSDAQSYADKSRNLRDLLVQCGFPEEHFATNASFREMPGTDSIGVGVSYKMIRHDGKDYPLLAVGIRGGAYGAEWASNFTMGRTGQHQGFSEARDQVLAYLREYIADQGITGDVKLWITGYSRAAATANLTAGALDGGCSLGEGVRLAPENLYAYCFECPQGAALTDRVSAPVYRNIFNIVNPADMVTKVGPTRPARFGFRRFGVNCYLPTALKEGEAYPALHQAMMDRYEALPHLGPYVVDDFQMKKLDVERLLRDPSGALRDGILVDNLDSQLDLNAYMDDIVYLLFACHFYTRSSYVNRFQNGIREACRAMFGSHDGWENFSGYFLENIQAQSERITYYLLLHMHGPLRRLVENALTDALRRAGITDYAVPEIRSFALRVVNLMFSFGITSPNLTATALDNLPTIAGAHFPEVCLAWMQSFDPNFTPQASASFNNGVHRLVRIHAEADIRVYDREGRLVAAIVGGAPQLLPESSIVSCVTPVEEKVVYLPADETYRVEVESTADGPLSYAVQEYSEEAGGVNRILNYDVTLHGEGETYTGIVPELKDTPQTLQEGSCSRYALRDGDGAALAPREDLRGEDAQKADCRIETAVNDETLGSAIGTTTVKAGQWVSVQAVRNGGARFLGWYQEGRRVSRKAVYSFAAAEDVHLEARFAPGYRMGR